MFHGWPRARTPALVGLRLRFACGETARAVIGPTFWVCRAKSGAAFRCAKPPCAVVRFAAMASPPRTAVLPFPSRLRRAGAPTAKPRRLSPFGSISLRETALAGRCPRRGQRARCPIFALLKCGPALAPRRSAPFHSKTIVRFRMSVSPEFSVFFICPPPFFASAPGRTDTQKSAAGYPRRGFNTFSVS